MVAGRGSYVVQEGHAPMRRLRPFGSLPGDSQDARRPLLLSEEQMNHANYPADPISVVDAAKRMGVHKNTIRNWIKIGAVNAWKIGPAGWGRKRRVMVSMAQVLACVVEPVIPQSGSRPDAASRRR